MYNNENNNQYKYSALFLKKFNKISGIKNPLIPISVVENMGQGIQEWTK